MDDGRKDNVLEGLEVNGMLDLNSMIAKRSIVTVSCLLAMKALNRKCIQVKRTLERDALDGLK